MNAGSSGQKNPPNTSSTTLVNSKLKQHSKETTWNMMYCFASDEDEDYAPQRNTVDVPIENRDKHTEMYGSTGGCVKTVDASKDVDG